MMGHIDRPFKFIAGNLSLDFANTVGWPPVNQSREPLEQYERFTSFGRFLQWAQEAGLISEQKRLESLAWAETQGTEPERQLRRAVRLRCAIHWIILAATEGRPPHDEDLEVLNAELHRGLTCLRIAHRENGFAWQAGTTGDLSSILFPVALAAANLLTSETIRRVRPCAAEPCGFLFVDTSPSGRRRWCIMEECGNRAKARRHYQRTHVTLVG